MNKIEQKTQAKVKGLKRYFTGVPCKNGHISERVVSSGVCLGCKKQDKIKNKSHGLAHRKVHNAVKRKFIEKKPCEHCGITVGVEGHHDDYGKPLDVIWLCKKHHIERHKELRKLGINPADSKLSPNKEIEVYELNPKSYRTLLGRVFNRLGLSRLVQGGWIVWVIPREGKKFKWRLKEARKNVNPI